MKYIKAVVTVEEDDIPISAEMYERSFDDDDELILHLSGKKK